MTRIIDYYVSAVPGLSLHANVRYFGRTPTSDANTLYIPGWTVANAGLQYETMIGECAVTFTGNVNDLLNQKYWVLVKAPMAR